MECKICKICKLIKDISEYHKKKSGRYGVMAICGVCSSIESKKKYSQNPEIKNRKNKQSSLWRKENIEKCRIIDKMSRLRNKDINNKRQNNKYNTDESFRLKCREYGKKYNELFPEKIKKKYHNYIEKLPDSYLVKILLKTSKDKLNVDEIPKEIIETKRLIILLKREIKPIK